MWNVTCTSGFDNPLTLALGSAWIVAAVVLATDELEALERTLELVAGVPVFGVGVPVVGADVLGGAGDAGAGG